MEQPLDIDAVFAALEPMIGVKVECTLEFRLQPRDVGLRHAGIWDSVTTTAGVASWANATPDCPREFLSVGDGGVP